jgi:hypothetical protein
VVTGYDEFHLIFGIGGEKFYIKKKSVPTCLFLLDEPLNKK